MPGFPFPGFPFPSFPVPRPPRRGPRAHSSPLTMTAEAHAGPAALVVDDEPALRRVAVRALTRAGLRCEAAANGAEALDLLAAGRFDVLLTDLNMPVCDGRALCDRVLGLVDRPAVVVLTGVIEPDLEANLLARGVARVLHKPVGPKDLARTLLAAAGG